jgi:hypothetical protein
MKIKIPLIASRGKSTRVWHKRKKENPCFGFFGEIQKNSNKGRFPRFKKTTQKMFPKADLPKFVPSFPLIIFKAVKLCWQHPGDILVE